MREFGQLQAGGGETNPSDPRKHHLPKLSSNTQQHTNYEMSRKKKIIIQIF